MNMDLFVAVYASIILDMKYSVNACLGLRSLMG